MRSTYQWYMHNSYTCTTHREVVLHVVHKELTNISQTYNMFVCTCINDQKRATNANTSDRSANQPMRRGTFPTPDASRPPP